MINKNKKKLIQISLNKEIIGPLEELCSKCGMTKSQFITLLICKKILEVVNKNKLESTTSEEKGENKMLNKTILIGRLTKDIEVKELAEGKHLTKFSLAVESGEKDVAYFFDIICFDTLTKSCSYLHKGDKVAVEGKLTQRKFTRKDGTTASVVEIIANSLEFVDVKVENNEQVQ